MVAGGERRPTEEEKQGREFSSSLSRLAELCLRGPFLISLYTTPSQLHTSIPNPETEF